MTKQTVRWGRGREGKLEGSANVAHEVQDFILECEGVRKLQKEKTGERYDWVSLPSVGVARGVLLIWDTNSVMG